ncbi:MAG: hypothetical protein JSS98_17110, partial [Bacteroidetes bacterium]|nr:hypothetical protein [Bacteroidota bacterium]
MLDYLIRYGLHRSKTICLLIFLILHVWHINAQQESYLNELKGVQIATDSFFTVSDEKFNDPSSWSLIDHNISTDNIISLELNYDTTIFFYSTPFSYTAHFKIFIYGNESDTSKVTDSTTYSDIALTVSYDTTTGKSYKGIALYKFNGVYKYKVKVLSISSTGSPAANILRLKGQIIVDRKYTFNNTSTDVTTYSVINGNQLKLQWTPANYPGAEMFDVEYTHIDGNSRIANSITSYQSGTDYNVPTDSLDKWFKNNSSRITTAASEYMINAAYDSGFVLFRIRGVQIHDPDNIRWEGNWNYYAHQNGSSCSLPSCPKGVVLFDGHEKNLNWQYSATFAEEGKRKEVVSYFDGSLRNRQSVTINNTDNKNIVQETIYDVLGRPAVNILPVPTNDSTIHYFRGFNKDHNSDPYSYADLLYSNCKATADSLTNTTGAGRYYSSNNEFLNNYYYAKYIPDAGGYPLTVTDYMPDNTGRIKSQGGVGTAFQLGSGHETSYYYGKPTQTELDRLFGLEAGNASHYLKNMVVDPNGQISVSYVDAGGKTVATALAGETPLNMHSLPSNTQGAVVNVTNNLLQSTDFSRNSSTRALTASATFLAPV